MPGSDKTCLGINSFAFFGKGPTCIAVTVTEFGHQNEVQRFAFSQPGNLSAIQMYSLVPKLKVPEFELKNSLPQLFLLSADSTFNKSGPGTTSTSFSASLSWLVLTWWLTTC